MPKKTIKKVSERVEASESDEPMTQNEIATALARKKAKQADANRTTKTPAKKS